MADYLDKVSMDGKTLTVNGIKDITLTQPTGVEAPTLVLHADGLTTDPTTMGENAYTDKLQIVDGDKSATIELVSADGYYTLQKLDKPSNSPVESGNVFVKPCFYSSKAPTVNVSNGTHITEMRWETPSGLYQYNVADAELRQRTTTLTATVAGNSNAITNLTNRVTTLEETPGGDGTGVIVKTLDDLTAAIASDTVAQIYLLGDITIPADSTLTLSKPITGLSNVATKCRLTGTIQLSTRCTVRNINIGAGSTIHSDALCTMVNCSFNGDVTIDDGSGMSMRDCHAFGATTLLTSVDCVNCDWATLTIGADGAANLTGGRFTGGAITGAITMLDNAQVTMTGVHFTQSITVGAAAQLRNMTGCVFEGGIAKFAISCANSTYPAYINGNRFYVTGDSDTNCAAKVTGYIMGTNCYKQQRIDSTYS